MKHLVFGGLIGFLAGGIVGGVTFGPLGSLFGCIFGGGVGTAAMIPRFIESRASNEPSPPKTHEV